MLSLNIINLVRLVKLHPAPPTHVKTREDVKLRSPVSFVNAKEDGLEHTVKMTWMSVRQVSKLSAVNQKGSSFLAGKQANYCDL